MSGESHLRDDGARRSLLDDEKAILRAMLGSDQHIDLDDIRVLPIGDQGMHSIAFLNQDGSLCDFGGEICKANYLDKDGVLVSISLTVDQKGRLFELDLWKVDFQPLKRYPNPGDLTDISRKPIDQTLSAR